MNYLTQLLTKAKVGQHLQQAVGKVKPHLQQVVDSGQKATANVKPHLQHIVDIGHSIKSGYKRIHYMKLGLVGGVSLGSVASFYQIGQKGFDPKENLGLIGVSTLLGGFGGYYYPHSLAILVAGGAMGYYGYYTRQS